MTELRSLSAEKENVSAQVTRLIATKSALQTLVNEAESEAAVEKWAYEEGKWVKSGEVLVEVIPESGQSFEPTPVASPTPVSIQNWQLWMSLVIDLPSQNAP